MPTPNKSQNAYVSLPPLFSRVRSHLTSAFRSYSLSQQVDRMSSGRLKHNTINNKIHNKDLVLLSSHHQLTTFHFFLPILLNARRPLACTTLSPL